MGRKKIAIEEIKDSRNQQVTYTKRKNGLHKKAMELSVLTESDILIFARTKTGKISVFSSNNDIESVVHDLQNLPDTAEYRDNAQVYKACFGTDLRQSKPSNTSSKSMLTTKRKSTHFTRGLHHSKMKRLDSSGASSASQFDSDSELEHSDDQWANQKADQQQYHMKNSGGRQRQGGKLLRKQSGNCPNSATMQPQTGFQLPIAPLHVPDVEQQQQQQQVGGLGGMSEAGVAVQRNERIALIANQLAMEVAIGNVSQDKLLGVVGTLQSLQVDPQQVITLVLLALPGAQEKARQLGQAATNAPPDAFGSLAGNNQQQRSVQP